MADAALPDEEFEAPLVYLRDERSADGCRQHVDLLQVELSALLDVLLINVAGGVPRPCRAPLEQQA